MWQEYPAYVPVAQRRANAAKHIQKLEKQGHKARPVHIEGKTIAQTFWGKAWCDNLEAYSDFESRLPRGRSYVRNGSVCDLQIEPGQVKALVCGTELYEIEIGIKPLPSQTWEAIKRECAGQIGSLIELLQGKFSESVMRIITRLNGGLFPKPAEIKMDCSCPDYATMCKHVAATMYGIGARLDEHPELLFLLRKVDHLELISQAGDVTSLTQRKGEAKTIAADALSDVFGIDFEAPPAAEAATTPVIEIKPVKAPKPAKAAKSAKKPQRKPKPAAKKRGDRRHARAKGGPDARPKTRGRRRPVKARRSAARR